LAEEKILLSDDGTVTTEMEVYAQTTALLMVLIIESGNGKVEAVAETEGAS